MSEPVMKDAIVVGAYYDEAKKAIVLNSKIEGIETVFQTPLGESSWKFPEGCIDREREMRKTAELFNSRKGMVVRLQFDGGQINGNS